MRRTLLCFIAMVSLVPTLASAGEDANAASVTGETGLFTLLTGDTLPRGGWSFGLYYNNWDHIVDLPGAFRRNTDKDLAFDQHQVSVSLGYGLTDRWEFSVMAPWEKYRF